MGNHCCAKEKERKNIVLLLLGLDNAGKTVAVKKLARESVAGVVPTVGFSVVQLQYQECDIKVFDLGGKTDFRDIWQQYFVYAHGIIFVIDSSDYDRLDEAEQVLTKMISHDKIHGKPLLLLASKQDHENALDEIDLIEKLQLESIVNHNECPTLVEMCSALDINKKSKLDPGIKNGYNWILNYIRRDYEALNGRVELDVEKQEEQDRKDRQAKIDRIKYLSEREENRNNDIGCEPKELNGLPITDIFIIKNNKFKHSDSDSSGSTDSLPRLYYGSIRQECLPEQRPQSATNVVRQQLEMDNLHRKNSFRFGSNKTTPVHLYGTRAPRSAGERRVSAKQADRRNLKSAGDSVFVVSPAPKFSLPVSNGSGDLQVFELSNSFSLPPINDTKLKLPNGVQKVNYI